MFVVFIIIIIIIVVVVVVVVIVIVIVIVIIKTPAAVFSKLLIQDDTGRAAGHTDNSSHSPSHIYTRRMIRLDR